MCIFVVYVHDTNVYVHTYVHKYTYVYVRIILYIGITMKLPPYTVVHDPVTLVQVSMMWKVAVSVHCSSVNFATSINATTYV